MVFVLPGLLTQGSQGIELRFPYRGKLQNIYASCSVVGATDTAIAIEKCSQVDYDTDPNWQSVLTSDLILQADSRSTNTSPNPPNIAIEDVEEGDHFRVVINEVGEGVANITVEVEVEVDITI